MKQEALLTDVPVSRRTDPSSSYRAEEEINRDGTRAKQQIEVLELVSQYPGRTSRELAGYTYLDRYQIARRLADLQSAGLVRQGFMRMCRVGHRKAVEWYTAADWARKVDD